MIKINYVSGSRADFGLMEKVLRHLDGLDDFDISIAVTGQHLLAHYGHTLRDIEASGLAIAGRIPVSLTGAGGAEMAQALAQELLGFVALWQENRPDLVLVLGDRGEMLAATLAAVHLGIHVAHLHGGEVSGTLDESLRHAISKLAHFHLAATEDSRQRLIAMGERADRIWTVGAPGLVGLGMSGPRRPGWMAERFGLRPSAQHHVLVVFHPVVQEAGSAGAQMAQVLAALRDADCAALVMRPNSDAGGAAIDNVLAQLGGDDTFQVRDHLDRDTYLMALGQADALVGNSSSGIIESASFGTPCLNLGNRQHGRLRNANVVDCVEFTPKSLAAALVRTFALQGPFINLYGDGQTAQRLAELLPKLPTNPEELAKTNAY